MARLLIGRRLVVVVGQVSVVVAVVVGFTGCELCKPARLGGKDAYLAAATSGRPCYCRRRCFCYLSRRRRPLVTALSGGRRRILAATVGLASSDAAAWKCAQPFGTDTTGDARNRSAPLSGFGPIIRLSFFIPSREISRARIKQVVCYRCRCKSECVPLQVQSGDSLSTSSAHR